jgi:EF-P beta-lysylation protein EpmB
MKSVVLSGDRLLPLLGQAPGAASGLPFEARATRHFVDKIAPGAPNDPLLLQILPRPAESLQVPEFDADPVADAEHQARPGLIHKYRNRVLLLASSSCPIHCRYCFRKEFPYGSSALSDESVAAWREYIAAHPQIEEVVFSGGDPLFTSLTALSRAVRSLLELRQLRTVRFHSRVATVCPELVSEEFLDALAEHEQARFVFVLHVNHRNELDAAAAAFVDSLRARRFLVLSQSVLLRDVNDDAATLKQLFDELIRIGVMPYYLNLLDRVSGAAHFEVSEQRALELYRELLTSSSGYAVPKLVRDDGKAFKSPICPAATESER